MESKHGLRYWTWIALVTIYGELFFHADGARLRKPTPSSTSWQRQVFGSSIHVPRVHFLVETWRVPLLLYCKHRHARPKRTVKRAATTRALLTASCNVSKGGRVTCAMSPFARKVSENICVVLHLRQKWCKLNYTTTQVAILSMATASYQANAAAG